MRGHRKGANFERDVCRKLSLWWTEGKQDDVFWRTAASGARATSRAKRGKTTVAHAGDVSAVLPIGEPLTRLCALELKTGYVKTTLDDLLETIGPKRMWEAWVEQAVEAAVQRSCPYWLLIRRRLGKSIMIIFPVGLRRRLERAGAKLRTLRPYFKLRHDTTVIVCRLDTFLECVHPRHVRKAEQRMRPPCP